MTKPITDADIIVGAAQSFYNDWSENEGRSDPECAKLGQALERFRQAQAELVEVKIDGVSYLAPRKVVDTLVGMLNIVTEVSQPLLEVLKEVQ